MTLYPSTIGYPGYVLGGMDVSKKIDRKTSSLSLSIELPDGHDGKLRLRKEGEKLYLIDEIGNVVAPKSLERSVYYERPKGPKFQAKSGVAGKEVSISGLHELAALDYFFAIDTNSTIINGVKISAAFLAKYRLRKDIDGYRLLPTATPPHLLEMYNCTGNPELAAILEIALEELDIQQRLVPNHKFKVGFITDTELGLHDAINTGQIPIHGRHFLPKGFSLIYSSTDTGGELTNTLIKFCDKAATDHFKRRLVIGFPAKRPQRLRCDPNVMCRYMVHSMTISTDPVPYLEVSESTKASITFEGEDGRTETHEINLP